MTKYSVQLKLQQRVNCGHSNAKLFASSVSCALKFGLVLNKAATPTLSGTHALLLQTTTFEK